MTTSDSGRGGSEEDIRSSMTISHDTGSTRCLNLRETTLTDQTCNSIQSCPILQFDAHMLMHIIFSALCFAKRFD